MPAAMRSLPSPASQRSLTARSRYQAACAALADCLTLDEVLDVKDEADRLKLYAKQADDREFMADVAELMLRARRQLGLILQQARAAGQIASGRPKTMASPKSALPDRRVLLREIG